MIRKMTNEDVSGVLLVEHESFSVPWSEKLFFDEMKNPHTVYFVFCENDEILGYGGMWHVIDEGQITNIAVRREARRKGIASKILEELINWAKSNEIRLMELEVRKGNFAAIGLYEKYGFKSVGERKNYYRNPAENAVLMNLELKDL